MSDDLNAIETGLAGLGRQVVRLLRPGLLTANVASGLKKRKLPVDADLETLYGWRDGTDAGTGLPLDDLHLVPGFYMLSLEDGLANYDAFVGDQRWDPSWLPVFANGGGDFLVVGLSRPDAPAPVRHFRIEESDHPVEYESLAAMVATFRQALDREIFFIDADGYLEMDDSAYATLAASMNPRVAWWNE